MADISRLTDMGFTEEQSRRALTLANNDVEKAIGFLVGESVEISNKEEVPDFTLLMSNQQNSFDSEVPAYEYSTSHIIAVSDDEGYEGAIDNSDSTTPDITLQLPKPKPREDGVPPVIVSPNPSRYDLVASAILTALLQIDEVKAKLKLPSESSFLTKLKGLIDEVETGENDYVVSNLAFPEDDSNTIEEFIPNIYDAITEEYEEEFNDDSLKVLVKSTVQTSEDEASQDISVIEIETDTRYSDIYDSLNELFWGKDLENLDNITFANIGSVLTFCYNGEDMAYYKTPMKLRDTIYPQVYSKELVPKLMEMNNKFTQLNHSKTELSNQLMKLSIFQGKRISAFLSQSQDFLQDSSAKAKLSSLHEKLNEEKLKLNKEMTDLLRSVDSYYIKNPANVTEGLKPYKAIFVGLNESEYFYFNKATDCWVSVSIGNNLDFAQEFTDFETVKTIILERSRQRTIPFYIIYCEEDKLYQKYEIEEPKNTNGEPNLIDLNDNDDNERKENDKVHE
ncbi:hypothetical protein PSN45_002951 [Yamadazyma tenuis]|uniref:UBA domain-containing protein n=1 Tax=Candida tenuis (strain ATCC 10573 / BCRC 21748 / CBS 615 / JCM 9827 / NBRC 10315 / NRRL Y-1498 / VKM Y-70) TaxID=590646 RepID=G3AW45_CANTC|nr:uncharacterized protein CANTEDRAFT_132705 [Yamadazyma tenuis ATCC 10573]EGV66449.1 hypothetical protein CANTEDRAFT_132705 [Yamadazyma tenuis ATCC 10573]WEJ95432.1 hypothetical protein PSN45_002951 [Yamadazyma tenuis]